MSDPRFYTMALEDDNIADLVHDIGEMLRTYRYHPSGTAEDCEVEMRRLTGGERGCTNPAEHVGPMHVLTAIVDEDDGGIIAYAIGEANAQRIAVALEDVEGPRGANG